MAQLRGYRAAWLRSDVTAGLSVAAVSLPSAIAYPAIAGLPVEVGLFTTIFSLIGYAMVGPSRQLMVGPDTATCIMLAGVLASLGAASETDRVGLTLVLALLVGVLCVAAGVLRLGFLANFLSRPMLAGFLTGISISLCISQINRLTAVEITTSGLLRPILEFAVNAGETHLPTLLVGLGTLAFLRVLARVSRGLPGPLLAVVLGISLSAGIDLESLGVAVIGTLPPIAFSLPLPSFETAVSLDLLGGALAIMLVGFGSGIVTARSFAARARHDVDADRELFGFGAANIFSGLAGGFPVTASDSRTAVNHTVGGKTQLTALLAASAVSIAVLFLADGLAYLPIPVLGAVLVSAAIDLIDLPELRLVRQISPTEFIFALITILGVVVVGVLQGVFIAVAATLAHLVWTASHPRLAQLGRIPGNVGLYKLHHYPDAQPIPGLTIVVLQSALVFFNADYAKRQLVAIANATSVTNRWFILDAAGMNTIDSTGVAKLDEVQAHLAEQGVAFGIADLNSRARSIVERAGLGGRLGKRMLFPSSEAAAAAFMASPTDDGYAMDSPVLDRHGRG